MFRIIQTLWIDEGRADRVRGRHMEPVDPDSQIVGDGERLIEARLSLDSVQRACRPIRRAASCHAAGLRGGVLIPGNRRDHRNGDGVFAAKTQKRGRSDGSGLLRS